MSQCARASCASPWRARGACLALGALLLAACVRPAPRWPELLRELRAQHPSLEQVSPAALRAELDSVAPPLLLDARAPAEFALSHLQGAQLAADESSALACLRTTPCNAAITVYCSVGLRSSRLAEQLRARGFGCVRNLEGGIFAWANAGLPLVRASAAGSEEPAREVHPYDAHWGQLLER